MFPISCKFNTGHYYTLTRLRSRSSGVKTFFRIYFLISKHVYNDTWTRPSSYLAKATFVRLKFTTDCRWRSSHPHAILTTLPPETSTGGLGNKSLISKRHYMYQRLDGEASISCHWQQVSRQSQIIWSPWLRHDQSQDGYFKSYWPREVVAGCR